MRASSILAVACAFLLAACVAPPERTPPPIEAPSATATYDLPALKRQAGIEDCPRSDPDVAAVAKGLPDVVLGCLGGGRDVRLAGLRGRPMMINIWAQWCPPCRAEAPHLSEVANANRTDLMIMGIDIEDPRPEWAIEFADLSGWTYPQLVDQEKVIAGPLQLTGPPVTLFVRADGTLAYRHAGAFGSTDQIRSLVREHLGVSL